MRLRRVPYRWAASGLCVALAAGGSRVTDAADPPPIAVKADVALDAFFHGAVIGLEGTKIRLRYDFSNVDQKAD